MGNKYAEIAFTDTVRGLQTADGSRRSYERQEQGPDVNDRLGEREAAFIGARDSFYMATVSEAGWPYVQHRGGPDGFVRVIDDRTLAFPDFRGNRQYVSVGNLAADDRVSIIFVDYPNRARLKLFGRVRVTDEADILEAMALPDYRGDVERAFLVTVEAFDWNCPRHITPRYREAELAAIVAPLEARIAELEGKGEG